MFAAFLIVALAAAAGVQGQSCSLPIQQNPKKEPLFVQWGTLSIAYPSVASNGTGKPYGVMQLQSNANMTIACTGKGNTVYGTQKQEARLSCQSGSFYIDGNKVDASKGEVRCNKTYAQSILKDTQYPCGVTPNNGIILQIGFQLTSGFIPLFDVCHNVADASTLYVRHFVKGQYLEVAVKTSDRPLFEVGMLGLYNGYTKTYMNEAIYSKKGEIQTLSDIIGTTEASKYIDNKNKYLAKGHLAPDADNIFNTQQKATYYYVNTAPQWQAANQANWLSLETAVRRVASQAKLDFTLHTGTYNILKLPNAFGQYKDIFLIYDSQKHTEMLPVPEIFWKIIQHPNNKYCRVAVQHNNVYLTTAPTPICKMQSTSTDWPALTNVSKGYTYYCTYQDFAKVVTFAPNITCNGLL